MSAWAVAWCFLVVSAVCTVVFILAVLIPRPRPHIGARDHERIDQPTHVRTVPCPPSCHCRGGAA